MEKIKEAQLKIKNQTASLRNTYGNGKEGELVALIGSSGLIEIAVRNGDARQLLRVDYGTPVRLKVK